MTPNQALLTGALMGFIMRQEFMDVLVEVEPDEKGNYTNTFTVVGRKPGSERLRVTVTVDPPLAPEEPPRYEGGSLHRDAPFREA